MSLSHCMKIYKQKIRSVKVMHINSEMIDESRRFSPSYKGMKYIFDQRKKVEWLLVFLVAPSY